MTASELLIALAEPFEASEVKWKPQSVKGDRALAMAFIDARCVQDRLDETLGVDGWEDDYALTPDGSVICRLTLVIGERKVTKMDVGSPSEQPDGGDRLKAAFSDALKRAAVKFGIGRYLYRLKAQWVDYDPVKRMFKATPKLPDFALPHRGASPADKPAKVGAPAESAGLRAWREIIAEQPNRFDLNDALPNLSALAKPDKAIVWKLILGYAKLAGWTWDKERVAFVIPGIADPEPSDANAD